MKFVIPFLALTTATPAASISDDQTLSIRYNQIYGEVVKEKSDLKNEVMDKITSEYGIKITKGIEIEIDKYIINEITKEARDRLSKWKESKNSDADEKPELFAGLEKDYENEGVLKPYFDDYWMLDHEEELKNAGITSQNSFRTHQYNWMVQKMNSGEWITESEKYISSEKDGIAQYDIYDVTKYKITSVAHWNPTIHVREYEDWNSYCSQSGYEKIGYAYEYNHDYTTTSYSSRQYNFISGDYFYKYDWDWGWFWSKKNHRHKVYRIGSKCKKESEDMFYPTSTYNTKNWKYSSYKITRDPYVKTSIKTVERVKKNVKTREDSLEVYIDGFGMQGEGGIDAIFNNVPNSRFYKKGQKIANCEIEFKNNCASLVGKEKLNIEISKSYWGNSLNANADEIFDVLTEFSMQNNHRPIKIYGYSMGGLIALKLGSMDIGAHLISAVETYGSPLSYDLIYSLYDIDSLSSIFTNSIGVSGLGMISSMASRNTYDTINNDLNVKNDIYNTFEIISNTYTFDFWSKILMIPFVHIFPIGAIIGLSVLIFTDGLIPIDSQKMDNKYFRTWKKKEYNVNIGAIVNDLANGGINYATRNSPHGAVVWEV